MNQYNLERMTEYPNTRNTDGWKYCVLSAYDLIFLSAYVTKMSDILEFSSLEVLVALELERRETQLSLIYYVSVLTNYPRGCGAIFAVWEMYTSSFRPQGNWTKYKLSHKTTTITALYYFENQFVPKSL